MDGWRTDDWRSAFSGERIVGWMKDRKIEESFSGERIVGGMEDRQTEESF